MCSIQRQSYILHTVFRHIQLTLSICLINITQVQTRQSLFHGRKMTPWVVGEIPSQFLYLCLISRSFCSLFYTYQQGIVYHRKWYIFVCLTPIYSVLRELELSKILRSNFSYILLFKKLRFHLNSITFKIFSFRT